MKVPILKIRKAELMRVTLMTSSAISVEKLQRCNNFYAFENFLYEDVLLARQII